MACHMEAHGLQPHEIIEVDMPTLGMFLGDAWQQSVPNQAMLAGPGSPPDTGLRAIMFTDMEGSTDLSSRYGDAVAVQALRLHDDVVRGAIAEKDGREVKHTGDGVFASFTSVTGAVEATMNIHRRLEDAGSDEPERSVKVRIGLSAGEPIADSDDLYGAAVNLAARICARANPRQTLVSGAVRELSIGKPFVYRDAGVVTLKGFQEPVQLYEVPWDG